MKEGQQGPVGTWRRSKILLDPEPTRHRTSAALKLSCTILEDCIVQMVKCQHFHTVQPNNFAHKEQTGIL